MLIVVNNMLIDTLQQDIQNSLKKGDSLRVSTLRMVLSAIRNAGIAKYGAQADESITEQDIQDVFKKQVKQHKESIEAYQKGNRQDLVTAEQQELDILNEFLPEELSDEAVKALLVPIVESGETNMGLLMKQGMSAVQGKADGKRVSSLLKELLQG